MPSREKGTRPWRTGQSVGRTLYDANDALIGTLDTPELAARAAASVNMADADWLVKDFEILYRSALDVSESIVEPERETPPQRQLRAQLERLRHAFEHVQSIKAELRSRREG